MQAEPEVRPYYGRYLEWKLVEESFSVLATSREKAIERLVAHHESVVWHGWEMMDEDKPYSDPIQVDWDDDAS